MADAAVPSDLQYVLSASISRYKCKIIFILIALLFLILTVAFILILTLNSSENKAAANRKKLSGIILIGGFDRESDEYNMQIDKPIDTFELYRPSHPSPIALPNVTLFHARFSHVAVLLGNELIYATGGNHTSGTLDTTEILDLDTLTLRNGPNLLEARADASGTVFEGKFVICGGRSKRGKVLDTCEEFDGNSWKLFGHLPQKRMGLQLVNLNSRLFAIGGLYRWARPAIQTFAYVPESGNWIRKANLNERRAFFATAVVNKSIFACGSFHEWELYSNTCEKYYPNLDIWKMIAHMHEKRVYFSMVVFDSDLWAFGGTHWEFIDGNKKFSSHASVERYNYENDFWKIERNLNEPRCAHVALVLP